MSSYNFSVIIIGAGSTGLLLAQGLKQKGVKATVYEREEATTYATRPREWGMTLHWGASFISTCISPEMQSTMNDSICCDPYYAGKDTTLPHFNGSTVTAYFKDGSSTTGSCIVGCDGANSVVRTLLVGEEAGKAIDLDIQMFNISCTFPREISLLQRNFGHPIFKNSYHPDGFMWWQSAQVIDDLETPESWQWQNILSWQGPPRAADFPDQASRTKFWKEQGEKFADPWRSVARALPDNLRFDVDRTTAWHPIDWSSCELAGRVTLAGDAAHCMPPHRGQGLNNALEDAAKLADQLSSVQKGDQALETAIQIFETEMRSRVEAEIPISIAQAKAVHQFDQLMLAPILKMGMHKYQKEQAEKNRSSTGVGTA